MPGTSLLPDRLLVGAAVVLTCVLFTRAALDPVNVPKLTALAVIAVALVGLAAARAVRDRVAQLPLSPPGLAAALLGAAFVVSAIAAPVTNVAIVGTYGRNSGLIAYLAALVLFLVSVRAFQGAHARVLAAAVIFAGLFTAAYGLLQKAGIDAIPWNNPFNPIIASLGNPNFASGYLGISASVAAGGALYRGWGVGWRAVSGATALLALLTAALSDSVQGPIAAGAGLFVVALALVLDLRSSLRGPFLTVLVLVAAAALLALIAGAATKAGPAGALFSDVGSEARTYYWGGALEMFRDAPLVGVGLDQYGNYWWSARSPKSIVALGPGQFSDAAHSVPLQMLAQGGLVLGLAYAAFVLVALFALVRGLITLQGPERMLLAAVGGGWAAYHVSSAVSIDQVPLIVLHFTLAGALIATSGIWPLREVRFAGAPAPVAPPTKVAGRKRRPPVAPPKPRQLTSVDLGALGAIALVGLVATWFALIPLRGSIAAKQGDDARATGDGTTALDGYEEALELVPSQSLYWIKKGQLFQESSPPQPGLALDSFVEAGERNPYEPNTFRAAAVIAEEQGDLALARRLHQRAVEVEPLNPDTVSGAATFELRHAGAVAARELLERTLARLPDGTPLAASLWAALGDARAVLGDRTQAREAYDRALTLQPDQPTALAGIEKLDA